MLLFGFFRLHMKRLLLGSLIFILLGVPARGQFIPDPFPPDFSHITVSSNNARDAGKAKAGDTITFDLELTDADTSNGGVITFSIGAATGFTVNFPASDTPDTAYTAAYQVQAGDSGDLSITDLTFSDKSGNSLTGFHPPPPAVSVDTTAPSLIAVAQVQNATHTPVFIFNSDEEGDITYNANCPAAGETSTATLPGDTTISFNNAVEGTYTNCRLTVTDPAGNQTALTLYEFEIDTTAPILTQISDYHTTFYRNSDRVRHLHRQRGRHHRLLGLPGGRGGGDRRTTGQHHHLLR